MNRDADYDAPMLMEKTFQNVFRDGPFGNFHIWPKKERCNRYKL